MSLFHFRGLATWPFTRVLQTRRNCECATDRYQGSMAYVVTESCIKHK
jgi:hypothetical protein